jgi:hypothetical protein
MQAEMREEMMAIMDANQESLEVNLDADWEEWRQKGKPRTRSW